MAASAYASLVSLTHVLDNVHYRAQHHRLCLDIVQIQTLQDRVHSLLDFVEDHSHQEGEKIRGLWRQISEVAFEAEQTFDSHVVNQLLCQSEGEKSDSDFSAFNEDVERLIQETAFIEKELSAVTMEGDDALVEQLPVPFVPSGGSQAAAWSEKDVLVGFDEHVVTIRDRLTSDERKLQIIPIIGMGGIGKTTLARNLYENSYIVDHFYLRFWLTMSQDYSALQILNGLLDEDKESDGSLAELGDKLHKTLFGRRYLIVMDDVWTTQACDDLMKYFPDNKNGSRIMMTTRLSEVATSLSCQNPYLMNFLNKDESWNLLCQKIFAQDGCPYPELESTGKDIAKSCRGLPLAITVIGSQLAKSNMTQEYWKFVYGNMYSLGNLGDDDHCLKILSLSYNNLPVSLKPCFLYLRTFREDSEIKVRKLINLWVDEGFIKPKRDKSLEDIAEEYFKDLVGRNLLFIRKRAIGGEILSCGIHDLLRELCFQEYDNEHFLCTPRVQHVNLSRMIFSVCCFLCGKSIGKEKPMVMNVPEIIRFPSSASEVGPYVCDKCSTMYAHIRGLKLVRVMDYFDYGYDRGEIMHPTGLRRVSFEYFKLILVYPSMLSVLWNLHTLIIRKSFGWKSLTALPPEIWDMPQLRNIDVKYTALPHPVVDHVEENAIMIMKNLQSLSAEIKSIEEILARIQNLKKLTLNCPAYFRIKSDCNCLIDSLTNIGQLDKLEVLEVKRCWVENISFFPNSLKKLELWNLSTPWKAITIIGSLPNLEELRLFYLGGWTEWMPVEGQFLRLKGLFMINCSLRCWEADQTHFPNLEWLKLSDCKHLLKIPLGIGDIATLRSIELKNCSKSANDSAKQLREEQESYGNVSLQLRVVHGRKKRRGFPHCS